MAVISVVHQGLQLGVQSVLNTGVAASKKLGSIGTGRLVPKSAGGETHTNKGDKLPLTSVPPYRHWSELPFDGKITFNEIVYLLCSAIKSVTPTSDGTNGKLWSFMFSRNAVDAKQYYTAEVGNSTRAKKAIDMHVNDLTIAIGQQANRITGTMMGGKRQDDITITASPTELVPKIVRPTAWDAYVNDTLAGLDTDVSGGTKFPLGIRAEISVGAILSHLWRMNSADSHFIATPENPVQPAVRLVGGDDDADYGIFLPIIESGATKWIRFLNLGDAIAGATASQEKIQIDAALRLIEPETPEEEENAALNGLPFQAIYDPTAGFALRIQVINTVASL